MFTLFLHVDDVLAVHQRAVAAWAKISHTPLDSDDVVIFKDPDGLVIEGLTTPNVCQTQTCPSH